jgi:hypothetical protein
MAAEALVRRCLADAPPLAGARPCVRELELADYDALFPKRQIVTGIREPDNPNACLYARALGSAWEKLPSPIRAMHDFTNRRTAEGRARIERGEGWISKAIARLFGFPPAGSDVPVRVTFTTENGGEAWQRDFAGHAFNSEQRLGAGAFEHLIAERFGPFVFGLAAVVDGPRLRLIVRRWTAFGIPLPLAWAPQGKAFEHDADARFNFHVEIGHAWCGLIVRYRGWLVPVD